MAGLVPLHQSWKLDQHGMSGFGTCHVSQAMTLRIDCDLASLRATASAIDRLQFKYAQEASKTGLPIIRPLFLVDPKHDRRGQTGGPTYTDATFWCRRCGRRGDRAQEVYLPSNDKWRDAWNPDRVYDGGQAITVEQSYINCRSSFAPDLVSNSATLTLSGMNRAQLQNGSQISRRSMKH